ncbi:MAG: hypothetical protein KKA60_06220 [Proteobacteria bacterium]|nr:hypothetical protein [Pseudomonadota bacterium]
MIVLLALALAAAFFASPAQARMEVMGEDDLTQIQAQLGANLILQARTSTGYIQLNGTSGLRLNNVEIGGNGTFAAAPTTDAHIGYETDWGRGGPATLDFFTRWNDPPSYYYYDGGYWINPPGRTETVVQLQFPDGFADAVTTPDLRADLWIGTGPTGTGGTWLGDLLIRDLYQRNSRLYFYVPQTSTRATWWIDSEWELDITEISLTKGTGQGLIISHIYVNQTPNAADAITNPGRGTGAGRIGRPERGATMDFYTTGSGTYSTQILTDFTLQGTIRVNSITLGGTDFGPVLLDYINTNPATGGWIGGSIEIRWDVGATFWASQAAGGTRDNAGGNP